jgi:oxygen-dependent protoporphyrinogen oxidase
MTDTTRVAIIGAGISGLTCAYELQKAGFHVEVFEKEPYVGGRMSSRAKEDHSFDLGAQIVSQSYEAALAYCKELGLPEQFRPLAHLTHELYDNNQLHLATYGTLLEFLRYSYLPPLARIRLLIFISFLRLKARNIDFFNLSTAAQFDEQNAYEFTVKWAGKEVADKVVDALVSAYHFHSSREMSLAAFLGCLNHFGRYFTFHQMVRDMAALPEAFAAKLTVHRRCPVHSLKKTARGVHLISPHRHSDFDIAVVATPGNITQRLLHHPSPTQCALLDSVRYSSTINIGYRVPSRAVADVSLVLVPESSSEWICSYFLPCVSAGLPPIRGKTLLNVFLRDARADELMKQTDDVIFQRMKRELLKVCPPLRNHGEAIEDHDLQRWPQAMPIFFPTFVQQVKRFWQEGQGDQNVYLCGDFLNTPWIEGSIRCGQRVAALIKSRNR